MGISIDLTGQKFESLTVLKRDETKKPGRGVYQICQCDCGKNVSYSSYDVKRKKSCGCLSRPKDTTSQLGKRYGQLVVIERDLSKETGHGKGSYWICQCDCGNIVSVKLSEMIRGHARSCGCFRKKQIQLMNKNKIIDLIGQKFDMVTITEITEKRTIDGSVVQKGICDCGTICEINGNKLKDKDSYCSCGCKKNISSGERKIAEILDVNQISYIREKKYKDLVGDGGPLRYDFAILNEQEDVVRLIEFDGIFHYKEGIGMASFATEEKFEKSQKYDKIKNEYAKKHNISLVRIPYQEKDNINLDMIMGDTYLC